MLAIRTLIVALVVAFASGCSTTQDISLAKVTYTKKINSVAQVAQDGNSQQMDGNLEAALAKEGLALRSKLPAGTATAKDVDALISYIDTWRWDIVMYMKKLTIRLNDAETGDLLAVGQWTESHFHQFRGEGGVKAVMEKMITDLMAKVRASSQTAK